jgi:hypothetical protein
LSLIRVFILAEVFFILAEVFFISN